MNSTAFSTAIPEAAAQGILAGSASERAEAIAQRCGGGRQSREGWQVCCPSHDDTHPSLAITPAGDKVLLHCFAGCNVEAVLAAIGLSSRDLFADDLPPVSLPKPRQTRSRIPEPPGPVTEDTIALYWLVQLLVDDITLLEIEAAQECLRPAAANPLQWLWLEQQLHHHGLTPAVVWQVIYPRAEYPYSREAPVPAQLTYRQRVAARMRGCK